MSVSLTLSNHASKVGQVGWKLFDGAELGWRLGLLDGAELFVGEAEGLLLGDADGRLLGFWLVLGADDGSAERVG